MWVLTLIASTRATASGEALRCHKRGGSLSLSLLCSSLPACAYVPPRMCVRTLRCTPPPRDDAVAPSTTVAPRTLLCVPCV